MSRWKFWEQPIKPPKPALDPPIVFRIPPRKDALAITPDLDPDQASRLRRLRQRRASVLYDVEQAEEATRPDNSWDRRIGLINEAMTNVEGDLKAIDLDRHPTGSALPPTPVEQLNVVVAPPPAVSFSIGDEMFRFEEDLDWSERGNQIARSELSIRAGDVQRLIPAAIVGEERARLAEHLANSLFAFASNARDRAVEGKPAPLHPTLADLAQPSSEHGDWLDWNGDSPEKKRRDLRRAGVSMELERFRKEQHRETEERARWEDRLPIARRRLAEIDAEIEALHKPSGSG